MLSTSQLELILLFLKQMQGSAMNFQRIEKMMPRMFDAVDMAVVQILAHYDRTQFQVRTVHPRSCTTAPTTVRAYGCMRPADHANAPRSQPRPPHLFPHIIPVSTLMASTVGWKIRYDDPCDVRCRRRETQVYRRPADSRTRVLPSLYRVS